MVQLAERELQIAVRRSEYKQLVKMEQQQQQQQVNLNYNKSVDELTNRLDQMQVDAPMNDDLHHNNYQNLHHHHHHHQQHNIMRNCNNHRLGSADSQDRMSLDDENMQPMEETVQQQQQSFNSATKRGESNILIVTNVDPIVFGDSLVKAKFESLFRAYDKQVLFRYLKSFRRIRLDFSNGKRADQARLNLNNYKLGDTAFKCYVAQMIRPNNSLTTTTATTTTTTTSGALDFNVDRQQQDCYNNQNYNQSDEQTNNFYLSIPKPSKQFLISPPVSPPEGWKPHDESSPCIDVQLISAIANLVPGQVHEIHPGNESQPGIFVEVCEENRDFEGPGGGGGGKRIPKTASPSIAAARAAISQAMRSS